jgi:hypothetical protein
MAPEETPSRRVKVLLAIRISVMMSMMADPPQRSVLTRKNTEKSEHELELAAGPE